MNHLMKISCRSTFSFFCCCFCLGSRVSFHRLLVQQAFVTIISPANSLWFFVQWTQRHRWFRCLGAHLSQKRTCCCPWPFPLRAPSRWPFNRAYQIYCQWGFFQHQGLRVSQPTWPSWKYFRSSLPECNRTLKLHRELRGSMSRW